MQIGLWFRVPQLTVALFFALCCAVLGGNIRPSWAADVLPTALRVACVGDSITYGAGVSDRETKTYPFLLGQWLGPRWDVRNFGASGATVLNKGNLPYEKRPHFQKALAFKPDVAIFLFGANDSKHGSPTDPKIADNWQYKADFANDYLTLISEFKRVNPKATCYVCLPVPALNPNRYGIDDNVIQGEIVPLVREVAIQSEAKLIDLYSVLNGKTNVFHDKVHPNDEGTRLMAAAVYRAMTGQDIPVDSALPTADQANALVPVSTPSVKLSAKEKFHIYVLMGQSNMVGRDTRTLTSQVDNPRVLALNGEGQWSVAHEPMHVGGTGIGPGIPFALEMLKADPTVTIGLVPCAVGGTSLGRWVKGADLYEKAISRAKIAADSGVIKGVLWHQGESDTTFSKKAEVYGQRAGEMFKDLRADLGLPNLPIVVGQIGEFLTAEKYPYVATVRSAIERLPTAVPNVGFASSAGLADKGDKLHFSADSEKELGARFAQAMQKLQTRQKP